jgi:hypothetical protein
MDAIDSGAWRTRLRWRARGALTWPLFVALTPLEVLFLHLRPISGDHSGTVGAFLLLGFVNLIVLAGLAPVLARVARRRGRAAAPHEIVSDRAAAGLLLGVAVVLVAAGIAHHPGVVAQHGEQAAMRQTVARYVARQAPAYRPGLRHARVARLDDHLYRACVPGPLRSAELCLLVATDQSPPGVSVDPDHEPDDTF